MAPGIDSDLAAGFHCFKAKAVELNFICPALTVRYFRDGQAVHRLDEAGGVRKQVAFLGHDCAESPLPHRSGGHVDLDAIARRAMNRGAAPLTFMPLCCILTTYEISVGIDSQPWI
jgi:hypothetical protein